MDDLVSKSAPIISKVFDEIKELMLEKNSSYNASILRPGRFGPKDPRQRLWCRIDDKLNRICTERSYPGDNDIRDLAGYFVALAVIDEMIKSGTLPDKYD